MDKGIKADKIYISKFIELGSGEWTDQPVQLEGLRDQFLDHLRKYDHVFTLRTLRKPPPSYFYELVEIPKEVLLLARERRFEMRLNSKQMPKPGYCYLTDRGVEVFQLYFDGGTERKLQVKHLKKSRCRVHATWEFDIESKGLEETDPT
ncbi:MAG TPA: hypothetical protein VHR66_12650 [Gemmataceae bacterium]|nr:hypothetical protein [Gemmataceae bacterium]